MNGRDTRCQEARAVPREHLVKQAGNRTRHHVRWQFLHAQTPRTRQIPSVRFPGTIRTRRRGGRRRCSRGVQSKVNLISQMPEGRRSYSFERPSDADIDRFAKILADRGVTVSVRKSRGRDIRAACGQLIVEGQRKSPAQQLAVML